MADVTNAALAEKITNFVDAVATRDEEVSAWVAGPASGGPSGDGFYPITDLSGFVHSVASPARIRADATGILGGVLSFATWAELAAYDTAGLDEAYGAKVYADAGTHTDPVTAATGVANEGVYRLKKSAPAGWERIANLEAADAAISATAAGASAVLAKDAADVWSLQYAVPNAFTPAEIKLQDTSRVAGGLTRITAARDGGGIPAWKLTSEAGQQRSFFYEFAADSVGAAVGEAATVSAFVSEVTAHSAAPSGSVYKAQLLLDQINASNGVISGTRVTVDIAGPSGFTFGNGERFSATATRHADTVKWRVSFTLRADSSSIDRFMYVRSDMLMTRGGNAVFRQPPPAPPVPVAYVSPSGSDTTGLGTATSPLATIAAAITAVNGNGTVRVLFGATGRYGPEQFFRPDTVKGKVKIVGEFSGRYPIIDMGAPLAAPTLHSGKVWKVATTISTEDWAALNWVWQDGVNDPRTLVLDTDRRPHHRGDTHWMVSTQIKKAAATTLAAAITELENATVTVPIATDGTTGAIHDPRCYYESGWLYFTVAGGGSAAAETIRVSSAQGLVYAGTREANGEIEIQGLDVRYGDLNLRPFHKSTLLDARVIGPRVNTVSFAGLFFGRYLRLHGAGSIGGDVGDNLNGHDHSVATVRRSLFSHAIDDGESGHENGSMDMAECVSGFNGGSNFCPAYGIDAAYADCVSIEGQKAGISRKPAGFGIVGAPADGGVDTRAELRRCLSIRDLIGFWADPANGIHGICIDCETIDPVLAGYVGVRMEGICRHTGTAPAKSAGPTEKPSTMPVVIAPGAQVA